VAEPVAVRYAWGGDPVVNLLIMRICLLRVQVCAIAETLAHARGLGERLYAAGERDREGVVLDKRVNQ